MEESTQGTCKQKHMSNVQNIWKHKDAKFFTEIDMFDYLFLLFLQKYQLWLIIPMP